MKMQLLFWPMVIFFVVSIAIFSVSCDNSKENIALSDDSKKNIALPHEMIQSLQEKNGVFELEKSETTEDVSLSLGMGGRTDYYYESPYQESLGHTENYATTNCLNNLHCINEAMRRYSEDHEGRLPPVFTTDENGKPLHSWRVLILPYFDNDKYLKCLYDQIRLDEPWNSEWNSQFHALIPRIYRCFSPLRKDKNRNAGETPYSVIIGENTV